MEGQTRYTSENYPGLWVMRRWKEGDPYRGYVYINESGSKGISLVKSDCIVTNIETKAEVAFSESLFKKKFKRWSNRKVLNKK